MDYKFFMLYLLSVKIAVSILSFSLHVYSLIKHGLSLFSFVYLLLNDFDLLIPLKVKILSYELFTLLEFISYSVLIRRYYFHLDWRSYFGEFIFAY